MEGVVKVMDEEEMEDAVRSEVSVEIWISKKGRKT